MPKLTDTQLVLLANAANRNDGSMLPLPRKSKLDRETADNIFKDLISRKLVAERTAAGTVQIWREDDAGQPVALTITPAACGRSAPSRTRPEHGSIPRPNGP